MFFIVKPETRGVSALEKSRSRLFMKDDGDHDECSQEISDEDDDECWQTGK